MPQLEPTNPIKQSIQVPQGYHGIVNATFRGNATKTMKVTDITNPDHPVPISFRRNCGGEMCQTTILVGSNDNPLTFEFELNGYDFECGDHGSSNNNLVQMGGSHGGASDQVSVSSYVYARDGAPSALDTVCITIIIQVGIDPSTCI